jgi:hypothetical protein
LFGEKRRHKQDEPEQSDSSRDHYPGLRVPALNGGYGLDVTSRLRVAQRRTPTTGC